MARITVYLSGSIAAYKGIEVVRGLQKAGHEVRVVMTTAATKLVGPATLNALTKYPVLTDLWNDQSQPIPHIELADWTELTLVVPASADLLAKMANGIADDAASTTLLATAAPKMVAPAMNRQMWAAPATQRNLAQLAEDGVTIIEPVTGRLAEGYSGHGRLPEPDEIVTRVQEFLSQRGQLAGKRVVVTAGGTREPLDPVRYIGNRSSGKMGIAIARAAAQAGAQVTLITGQVSVSLPQDANIHPVSALTTEEMLAAVQEAFVSADALIMAAAVADYRPVKVAEQKVKKGHDHELRTLELTETVDILRTIASAKRTDQLVVGFAAETEKLLDHAQEKLASKHADMIVANSVAGVTGAFGRDDDQVTILQKGKDPEKWPRLSKTAVAQRLVARLAEQLK
ncbi:bifunctional phosphopantothenoylcysteine decarboxylase/phosphopantothenate--cysteine ligase CoaBC [Limosilactobacillus pontis]|uniref:Coenzyme A biosynthesis bifunctional protein CoaBC n=1 Tax=Limosilactobacillus pontis TaxID=35787 RepID=A0ABT7UYL6_9LACO|nr:MULTISPECIES: bifunctional phosphopantothenoylcysteine decarboxylase/phosphopantothenate--cysteine ligase CoaBC [Limosilactobacillus]MDM8266754.1 bifunctional phosphopantothenoylcysteine decarboxylase/phosphopantothenate--cysteine ligase CoaBC [Limosilactobacillus pontis]